jgi:uncharacterized protein
VPLVIAILLAAAAQLAVPAPPTRRINDYAGALTAAERDRLERKLAERERTSSNQVVVAIFRSLGGENLEDYSIRLAQAWRIGQKGLDNGVIFLVFLEDRKMRLEVGYGLEATLTDATASSIIRDVVAPRFRERRFAEGIEGGLDAIAATLAGTYQRPVSRPDSGRAGWYVIPAVMLLVFGVVLVMAMAQFRRAARGGWTGRGAGWAPVSGSWGGSDSSGSGSSSSDSFSGGGGSFGGGGASGEW